MYTNLSGNKNIVQLGIIWGILLISTPVAQAKKLVDYNHSGTQAYHQKHSWRLYPITIQLNRNKGTSMPVMLLSLPEAKPKIEMLSSEGHSIEFSILYIKRALWRYFDCYPRLGLLLTRHSLLNEGNIFSGSVYLEPNYNHSTGWEFLSRLGIGIALARVPGHHYYIPVQGEDIPEVEDFMKGPSLDLGWGVGIRYRLTPKKDIYVGISINYLLALTQEKDNSDKLLPKKNLTLWNLNIGSSYTFNPNPQIYARTVEPRRSRIDIGILNSFRKAKPHKSNKVEADTTSTQEENNKHYYLGGLYAQGSLCIANNHALTLSSEWVKNAAAKKENEKKVRNTDLQVGVSLGHEFLWGKISFGQAAGFYLLNDSIAPPLGSFYTRLTLTYYITDFLFIGTSAKTAIRPDENSYVAFDYVDFRIGYSFSKKY